MKNGSVRRATRSRHIFNTNVILLRVILLHSANKSGDLLPAIRSPRRPRMRSVPFLAALLVAAPLLTGTIARAEDKLNIVAAENFYGDLARQIGGSNVLVTS